MINLSKKEKYPVVFDKNNENVKYTSYFCFKWRKRYEVVDIDMHLCHMFPDVRGAGYDRYGKDIEAQRRGLAGES